MKGLLVLVFFVSQLVFFVAGEELVFALVVVEQGEQTPPPLFPKVKSEWNQPGLTSKGMRNLYKLGETLRSRYILNHKLLSPNLAHRELHVRSASHPTPLMSSPSLLHGLFPPGTGPPLSTPSSPSSPSLSSLIWGEEEREEKGEREEGGALPYFIQPAPVFSDRREGDGVMYGYLNCRRLKMLHRQLRDQDLWRNEVKQGRELFQDFSGILGEHISLGDLRAIFDLHRAEKAYKHDTTIDETTWENNHLQIEKMINFVTEQEFSTPELIRLSVGLFPQDVAQQIQKGVLSKETNIKLVIYVGDNSFFRSVLKFFGAPISLPPHNPPSLSIEIFQTSPSPSPYYSVRLGYEGGGGSRNETEFSLDNFLNFLERESLGGKEWKRECVCVVEALEVPTISSELLDTCAVAVLGGFFFLSSFKIVKLLTKEKPRKKQRGKAEKNHQ